MLRGAVPAACSIHDRSSVQVLPAAAAPGQPVPTEAGEPDRRDSNHAGLDAAEWVDLIDITTMLSRIADEPTGDIDEGWSLIIAGARMVLQKRMTSASPLDGEDARLALPALGLIDAKGDTSFQ